ncbi:MAG: ACT domain-containing protein, partial [Zavarzinia sp.]|nr:ACT domain-containing protein [Zavarzinia sp.]
MSNAAILTLSCPDRPGIVARVSTYLFDAGVNILEAHQFDDIETGRFFMRVDFEVVGEDASVTSVRDGFAAIAEHFTMDWQIRSNGERRKVMILAS